jgi:hypothetical protein
MSTAHRPPRVVDKTPAVRLDKTPLSSADSDVFGGHDGQGDLIGAAETVGWAEFVSTDPLVASRDALQPDGVSKRPGIAA